MKLQFNLRLPAEVTLTKWTTPNLLEDKPSSGHLMMLGFKYFEPSLYQFPIFGSPKTPNQMFTPEILPSKGLSFSTVPSTFWFCPMISWAHWALLYTTLSLDTVESNSTFTIASIYGGLWDWTRTQRKTEADWLCGEILVEYFATLFRYHFSSFKI